MLLNGGTDYINITLTKSHFEYVVASYHIYNFFRRNIEAQNGTYSKQNEGIRVVP